MSKESFKQNILPLAVGKTLDNGLSTLRTYYCVKYRNFTQFPDVEILWKHIVSAEFRANCLTLCGNFAFPHQEIR